MTQPRLLLTRVFPDAVMARARRDYDCVDNPTDELMSREDLAAAALGCDAILCSSRNPFDAAQVALLPDSVRIVATFSVGYEHMDVAALSGRGIVAANTPDVLTEATADIAMMLLLCASRRAREALAMVTEDRWHGWTPTQLLGVGLQGRRLGILGMGRIGRALARRARAFGLDIHYHNRSRLTPDLEQGATYHADGESLLRVANFLSIHCEMTPETAGFLDARRIVMMPEGAVVVNTARGGIIDDDAFITALKSGRIAAAGLDVFDGEPNLNPGYRDLDNAFLTPHIGSATVDTRNAMGFRALDNIDGLLHSGVAPDALG